MNQRKIIVIYKSPPSMKLVFFSLISRCNRKKIGPQLSSELFSTAAMLLSPSVIFSSGKTQNSALFWSLFPFKVGHFSRETNQKHSHKQWHLSLATDLVECNVDRFIHSCRKYQRYSTKYQRISALYDKRKLQQIFLNTVLYFAKDKIAIPATCKEKLTSITLGEG